MNDVTLDGWRSVPFGWIHMTHKPVWSSLIEQVLFHRRAGSFREVRTLVPNKQVNSGPPESGGLSSLSSET